MPWKDVERQRAYHKNWYHRNRKKRIAQIRRSNERITAELRIITNTLKEKNPCADCGKKYPHWIMDFDHVRGKKLMDVSVMVGRSVSVKRLMDEIAKCEVVCSNCHRDRTHKRRCVSLIGRTNVS